MLFFVSLFVDGVLAGVVYAPIALAFVVVYKASRMINFALGEWAMVASRLVATGLHALGLGMALVGLKVFRIVIIGGLDSIPGTLAGAVVVGVLESLAAGCVDPLLGGGFSNVASYLVLIAMLFVGPYGVFGRPDVERVS